MKQRNESVFKSGQMTGVALVIGWVGLSAISGCGDKPVSKAQGDAMMASFKGAPETAADRESDKKDIQAAADYRKAHPELFPVPKYNVPPGGKPETSTAGPGTGPAGGTQ